MSEATLAKKSKALFRVTYRDGATFTTTAVDSVRAEMTATRKRPGAVKKITFLKKVSNG